MHSQLTKLWSCLRPLSRLQGHQVPAERDDGPQGLEDPPPATEEAPRDASPGARRLLRAHGFTARELPPQPPFFLPAAPAGARCVLQGLNPPQPPPDTLLPVFLRARRCTLGSQPPPPTFSSFLPAAPAGARRLLRRLDAQRLWGAGAGEDWGDTGGGCCTPALLGHRWVGGG